MSSATGWDAPASNPLEDLRAAIAAVEADETGYQGLAEADLRHPAEFDR